MKIGGSSLVTCSIGEYCLSNLKTLSRLAWNASQSSFAAGRSHHTLGRMDSVTGSAHTERRVTLLDPSYPLLWPNLSQLHSRACLALGMRAVQCNQSADVSPGDIAARHTRMVVSQYPVLTYNHETRY